MEFQGFQQVLKTWGGGGASSKFDGGGVNSKQGGGRGALKGRQKNLGRSSFDSKFAGYKPASLQIY